MGKKILIAFDDSENAIRAVKFIVDTFSPENRITLFSVIQDTAALCDMNSPELTPYFREHQGNFCALEDKKKSLISKALEEATALLRDAGFPEGHISVKVNHKAKGVARDIISEGRSGYDLVVLGRRGITGIREFFFGSVSQKVLQGAGDISILVIN